MTTATTSTFRDFPTFDEHSAPEPARADLAAARAAFGGVPVPLARLASSPIALAAAQHLLAVFEKSGLAPLEREVVAMTLGRVNGCHFCIGLHTKLLGHLPGGPALARALTAGERLAEPRLAALQRFVEAALERRGDVDADAWRAFVDAGFTHADALDVIVGIGTYTLTTFANRLTEV